MTLTEIIAIIARLLGCELGCEQTGTVGAVGPDFPFEVPAAPVNPWSSITLVRYYGGLA